MREIRWKRLRAIAKSMQLGASTGAACEAAKINRITLWRWRKQDKKVNEFILRLIDHQIQVVEDALYKRAVGYRYEEETKEREIGTSEKKTAKIVVKEVVPDVTACMFILMNRASDRWSDKRALVNQTIVNRLEQNNNVSVVSKLKDEELDGIINRIKTGR